MSDCDRCKKPATGRDGVSIRCYGVCKKIFHYTCTNSEKYATLFKECMFAKFVCLKCQTMERDAVIEGFLKLDNKIEELTKLVNEGRANIETKVNTIHNHIENTTTNVTTYADMVKAKPTRVVIVQPKDNQSIMKTKEDIRKQIDPTAIPIMGSTNTNTGGIILHCDSEEASRKLEKMAIETLGDQYNVKVPVELLPRVKILGVTENINEDEIVPVLKKQNLFLGDSNMKVITILRRKNMNKYDIVLEVNSSSFNKIMEAEKLNIRFERCRVVEGVNIKRCYRCNGFAHKAEECTKTVSCPKCAGNHTLKECTNQHEQCINCKTSNEKLNLNLDTNHAAWNSECIVYKRKIMALKNKISYK